jgi:hypothetical protein
MEKNIKATQRRAVQYWFADGLAELIGGVMCLLLAIYFIIQQILQAAQTDATVPRAQYIPPHRVC